MGFGRIGKSLIQRCLGFEMKVKVFDPFVKKETIEKLGGQKIENLDDGLKNCDYVSLHVPLNEKTKNLIKWKLIAGEINSIKFSFWYWNKTWVVAIF